MLKRYLNFFIIIAILALPAVVFAAWRDAPAAAPNYGAVSPDTQADYKPMNLGSTDQIKSGGAQFATDAGKGVKIGNYSFFVTAKLAVADNSSSDGVIIAQQQGSGYAVYSSGGINYFGGNVGIAQTPASNGAKLAVNNPTVAGKVGSSGDSIYAYASSTNAAVSAEQGDTAGYAVYASGKSAFMNGNVGIGTTIPGVRLAVKGEIGGPAMSGGSQTGVFRVENSSNNLALDFGITNSAAAPYSVWLQAANKTALGNSVNIALNPNGGNVGIGTTVPLAKASIIGASLAGDGSNQVGIMQITTGTGVNTDNKLLFGVHDNDYSWIQAIQPGTNVRNLSLNPIGGNVGIGTTGPGAKLDLDWALAGTPSALLLQLENSLGTNSPKAQLGIEDYTAKVMTLSGKTGGAGLAQIMSWNLENGSVGIGTTVPSAKLSVSDNNNNVVNLSLVKTIGGSNNLTIGNTFSGGSTFALNAGITGFDNGGFEIRDVDAGVSRIVIKRTTGNVGIGIPDPGIYKLDVAGMVNVSQLCFAGQFCQSSWSAGGPLIIENRTGDPVGPSTGRMWLITP